MVDVSLSVVMLAGLGVVLVGLDWRLGLAMVIPVPVFCWLIWRHGESINRLFLRAWRKWSRVSDVLSDTIPGIRVVKAFTREEREVRRFGAQRGRDGGIQPHPPDVDRLLAVADAGGPRHHRARLGARGAAPAGRRRAAAPAGTFVAFLLYATMFIAPIEVIGQIARTMNRATTSAHRVFEVLDTEAESPTGPTRSG